MAPTDGGFKDILEERRKSSDVKWAARTLHPKHSYILPHKHTASSIKIAVLRSARLRQVIRQISEDEHTSGEELYRRVWEILEEMGFNKEIPVLRWLGLCVAKILKRICSAIFVNEETLLQIKSKMGQNPVLFVPTHRSYGDFILMSYICFHYDIDIPRIAAGMDFHGMMILGEILRDACAFFMRRTFSNDKLYSATFSEYVQTLVTHGDAGVEFFIEGTRSRTSKALMPKFGFLSMVLKPYLLGLVPDVSVVPVTMSYDRCVEEALFAYELLGVPKPKESTKGFFKALKILKDDYGKVFVNFGDPISVKDYLEGRVDRSVHSFGPVMLQDLTPTESRQVVALAHTIVKKQRDLTVLSCFNVVAAILNNSLLCGYSAISIDHLASEVRWLSQALRGLGAIVDVDECDVNSSVRDCLSVHKSLISVVKDKVQLSINEVHLETCDCSKLRGYNLSPLTMDTAIPLVMLQNYVNPSAHYFIHNTSFVYALKGVPNHKLSRSELFKEYRWFRRLFAHEFVFYYEDAQNDFERSLAHGFTLGIICHAGNDISLGSNQKLQDFAINYLAPFLPGYVALVDSLAISDFGEPLTENQMLKMAQMEIEKRLNSAKVSHAANLSLDLISNCVNSLASLGALLKVKSNGSVNYLVNEKSIEQIRGRLLPMAMALPRHQLDLIKMSVTSKL